MNKITIKFGTELKPTKLIVINYNFTISPFGYSVTKPLKQTLDLNKRKAKGYLKTVYLSKRKAIKKL